MSKPSEEEISALLARIISDGFNRSLAVLKDQGVVNERKLSRHYQGVGSKYYDLVTQQIEHSARLAAPAVRNLFDRD